MNIPNPAVIWFLALYLLGNPRWTPSLAPVAPTFPLEIRLNGVVLCFFSHVDIRVGVLLWQPLMWQKDR